MSSANALTEQVLLAASAAGHRLFRQNVGLGWVGKVTRLKGGSIRIDNPRPLHAGLAKGSADLVGWCRDGIFASIEIKYGNDRVSPDQEKWVAWCIRGGTRAGIARTVDEAMAILEGHATSR